MHKWRSTCTCWESNLTYGKSQLIAFQHVSATSKPRDLHLLILPVWWSAATLIATVAVWGACSLQKSCKLSMLLRRRWSCQHLPWGKGRNPSKSCFACLVPALFQPQPPKQYCAASPFFLSTAEPRSPPTLKASVTWCSCWRDTNLGTKNSGWRDTNLGTKNSGLQKLEH